MKTTAESRSPERQVLANAIAARRQAEAAVKQADHELADFDERLKETKRLRWRAAESLEEAEKSEREVYRACAGNDDAVAKHCALAGIPHPKDAIKKATVDLEDATRKFELGSDGRRPLAEKKIIADDTLAKALRTCEAAADIVQQSDVDRLVAEAEAIQADLVRRRLVLIRITGGAKRPDRSTARGARLADLFNCFQMPQPEFMPNTCRPYLVAALAPWNACRAALLEDADVDLPGVKS